MSRRLPVSLHVSLAPRDLRHAAIILPHQLRVFGPHVEEIVLTIDLGPKMISDDPSFPQLRALAKTGCDAAPRFDLRIANYSAARRRLLSETFLRNGTMPAQTYRAGPFHAYFDGWLATQGSYLFHTDSDMFYGGEAGQWLAEAIALLERDQTLFACNPLPGPPHPDGNVFQPNAVRMQSSLPGAHAFDGFTTRLFFMSRRQLTTLTPKLGLRAATWRCQLRGLLEHTSRWELPEDLLSRHMKSSGLHRLDFLGSSTGLWSLHPPFRNAEFYRKLPELVRRVETMDMPREQLGHYDVNDSLVDWSDARAALATNRWWRRLLRH